MRADHGAGTDHGDFQGRNFRVLLLVLKSMLQILRFEALEGRVYRIQVQTDMRFHSSTV